MSLVDAKLFKVAKDQYFFKLKAYSGIWMTMISVQMIAMIVSFLGGSGSGVSSINNISLNITVYSADIMIIFMLMWAFISAILITSKENRYADFTFITNRLSSHLANIMFLVTASVIGGVTVCLSDKAVKLFVSSTLMAEQVSYWNLEGSVGSLFIGMVGVILYLLLFSTIGYFVGMLVQWFKGFIIILPSLLIGTFIIEVRNGHNGVLLEVIQFFGTESSLFLFTMKVIVTCMMLMVMTMFLTNRLEVRR